MIIVESPFLRRGFLFSFLVYIELPNQKISVKKNRGFLCVKKIVIVSITRKIVAAVSKARKGFLGYRVSKVFRGFLVHKVCRDKQGHKVRKVYKDLQEFAIVRIVQIGIANAASHIAMFMVFHQSFWVLSEALLTL